MARAAGVPIPVPATQSDTLAYGEVPGGTLLTRLFQDPDGIILQFDERLGWPVGRRR